MNCPFSRISSILCLSHVGHCSLSWTMKQLIIPETPNPTHSCFPSNSICANGNFKLTRKRFSNEHYLLDNCIIVSYIFASTLSSHVSLWPSVMFVPILCRCCFYSARRPVQLCDPVFFGYLRFCGSFICFQRQLFADWLHFMWIVSHFMGGGHCVARKSLSLPHQCLSEGSGISFALCRVLSARIHIVLPFYGVEMEHKVYMSWVS